MSAKHQMEDMFIELSEGQMSAVKAYYAASDDDELRRDLKSSLDAWDRHFNRPSTLLLYDRRRAALARWGAFVFCDGAGI